MLSGIILVPSRLRTSGSLDPDANGGGTFLRVLKEPLADVTTGFEEFFGSSEGICRSIRVGMDDDDDERASESNELPSVSTLSSIMLADEFSAVDLYSCKKCFVNVCFLVELTIFTLAENVPYTGL